MAVVSAIAIAAVAVVTCGFFVTECISSCTENYAHVKSCAQLESAVTTVEKRRNYFLPEKASIKRIDCTYLLASRPAE